MIIHLISIGCEVLFQVPPALDTSCWRNICKYIQFHLANFKLSWPYWSHWEQEYLAANYGDQDAVRGIEWHYFFFYNYHNHYDRYLGFCKVVVDGLSRCMFRPTLLITIPAAFKDIARDSPPLLPMFDAFNNDPKSIVARKVAELLESRQDADTIEDFIDSEHEGIDLSNEGDTWQVILLVQAIIRVSNRLLSTLLTLLDTYRDLVRIFLDVEGGQEVVYTRFMINS